MDPTKPRGPAPEVERRTRKTRFTTMSGIPVHPLYEPETGAPAQIGRPGEFPFTRGVHPTMYRGRLWTLRMFAGFGTPEDTNRRFRFLLEQGQTGLSTAFDMPTLMGYDPDHPLSLGEVGREGVSVASVEDMEVLFDGIPLDRVTTSMTINAPAIVLLAFYVVAAERRGIPASALGGTTQNDILKEFIAQKEWICPPRPAMRIIRDMIAWCSTHMPKWNTISISGYHIREAGATAVQELAFTLADGIEYVKTGLAAGLDVDAFAPRLSFFFDVHSDFFEEIAKFRAARRIWATALRDRFGAKDPKSWMLRTHAQTAGVSLTAQQPYNNVVRTALQALAAVLGGTQSLHTNSMDETYALPTEAAASLALRTQQLIASEIGVDATPDPLGGSWYVEALTDEIERQAMDYIRRIDDLGGMVAAVEQGFPQREIAQSAFDFQKAVDAGERIIVGVNDFVSPEAAPIPTLKVDPSVEPHQREKLIAMKARRDPTAVAAALDGVRRAARGDDPVRDNLMAAIVDGARVGCTVGEFSDVFREVFGVYREPSYI